MDDPQDTPKHLLIDDEMIVQRSAIEHLHREAVAARADEPRGTDETELSQLREAFRFMAAPDSREWRERRFDNLDDFLLLVDERNRVPND